MVVMEGWLAVFRLGCPCSVNSHKIANIRSFFLKIGFSYLVLTPFVLNIPTSFFNSVG
jgi:hypothetical protein